MTSSCSATRCTDVGKPGADKLYHPIYISSPRISSGPRLPAEAGREIAWNYIHDNNANVGINVYSEGSSTAYMSGHRIHDNFIIDQKGEGMLLGSYMTGENWVYNNVIARAGLGPEPTEGDRAMNHIGVQFALGAPGAPPTTLHFYNNTIYGCGWSGATWGPSANGALRIDSPDQVPGWSSAITSSSRPGSRIWPRRAPPPRPWTGTTCGLAQGLRPRGTPAPSTPTPCSLILPPATSG